MIKGRFGAPFLFLLAQPASDARTPPHELAAEL